MDSRIIVPSPASVHKSVAEVVLETTFAAGYLHNFDWGCEAGVHFGYAIIESENEAQALLVVPPNLLSNARAIMLVKYDRSKLESLKAQGLLDYPTQGTRTWVG